MFNYYSNVCSACAIEWLNKRERRKQQNVQNAICFLMIKKSSNETEARFKVTQNCWLIIIWILKTACIYLTWTYRERLYTYTHFFFFSSHCLSFMWTFLSRGCYFNDNALKCSFWHSFFTTNARMHIHIARFFVIVVCVVVWRKFKLMASTPFNWFVTNFPYKWFRCKCEKWNANKINSSNSHNIKHNERPAGILRTHSRMHAYIRKKWLVCK